MPTPLRALLIVSGGVALLAAAMFARALPKPWSFAVGAVLVAAGLWLCYVVQRPALERENRRRLGLCVRCGYDLTGNVSGTCPVTSKKGRVVPL